MADKEPKYDFSMFGDKPVQDKPSSGYDFSMFEDVKKKGQPISEDLSTASETSSTTKSSSSSGLSNQPVDLSYLLEDYQRSFSPSDVSSRMAVKAEPKQVVPKEETVVEAKPSVAKKLERGAKHVPEKEEYEFVTSLEDVPAEKRAEHAAFMEGLEGYDEPAVIPQQNQEGEVIGYNYKTTVPDLTKATSAKDYFASQVVNSSVLGKSLLYSLAAVDAASGIKEDARTAAQDYQRVVNNNIEGYKDPESWLNVASTVVGIASDSPIFGLGGSLYKGTASGALKTVAFLEQKLVKSGLTKQLAKNIAQKTYLATAIEGAVGTAGALGLHGALADVQAQYGDASYEDIDYSQSFRRLGYGSLTGFMVGATGGFTGALANRVSDKYLLKALSSGTYNTATKSIATAQKLGVQAGGFAVEVGVFEVGNIIENGVDSFTTEGLVHNALVLGVLKGKAKLEHLSNTPPVRKGEPLYDISLSNRQLESIGYKRSANAVDALRANDTKLVEILNNKDVSLETKAGLLWATKGVKITKLPTPSNVLLDGDYLKVYDKDGGFISEVSTNELPNRNAFVTGMQRLVDHYNNILNVSKSTAEEYKAIDEALRSAKIEDGINNKQLVEILFKPPAEYSKEDVALLDKFNETVKKIVAEKPVVPEKVEKIENIDVQSTERLDASLDTYNKLETFLKTTDIPEGGIDLPRQTLGHGVMKAAFGREIDRLSKAEVDGLMKEMEQRRTEVANEMTRREALPETKEGEIRIGGRTFKNADEFKKYVEATENIKDIDVRPQDYTPEIGKIIEQESMKRQEAKIQASARVGSTISPETGKTTTQEQKSPTEPKTDEKRAIGGKDIGEIKKEGVGLETLSKGWRKLMKAEGLLPKEWYDEWVKQQSAMSAVEKDLQNTFKDFDKALRKTYGQGVLGRFGRPKVSKEQIEALNKALSELGSGETFRPEILQTIPEGMRDVILTMRENVDALSREMIRKGLVEGELEAIFDTNLGFYLNRSYRSYTDKSWQWDKIPLDIRNNAITWAKQEFAELYNRQLSDAEATAWLKSVLDGEGGYFSVIRNGKIGSKDLSIFKKRMVIPEELRKLMGEYEDPMYNYASTVMKMSDMLTKDAFLRNIVENGMGKLFFTEPTGEFFSKMTNEGNPSMRPLSDKELYTKPEFSRAFNEFLKASPAKDDLMGKFVKAYYIVNGSVKYGKTILSPVTHVRNFSSNFGFHMANFRNPMQVADVLVDVLSAYSGYKGKKNSPEWREYVLDLTRRGVLGDNVRAGEIFDVLNDVSKDYAKIDFGKRGLTKKAFDFVQKLYQAEDDIHKIVAFEVEKKRYLEVYKKSKPEKPIEELEEMAKEKAAKITRATMPTYSLVPEMIKFFRKVPAVGMFVSFPYEVFRTTWNTVDLAREELSNADTRHLGVERIAGLALAATVTGTMASASQKYFNVKKDDVKDLRRYLAPWNDNSDLFFIGEPKDGVYTFVDVGYSDPHNYIKRILNAALLEWDDPEKAFESALYELSQPFIGEDLLATTIMDIRSNKKSMNGQPIYNEADTPEQQMIKKWGFLFDNLKPGLLVSGERISKALQGDERYRLGEEITANALGIRITRVDTGKNFKYKVLATRNLIVDAKDIYKDVLREYNNVKKDLTPEQKEKWQKKLDSAYDRSNKQLENILNELRLDYDAAIKLGAPPKLIRTTLSDMIRDDSAELIVRRGRYRKTRKQDGGW